MCDMERAIRTLKSGASVVFCKGDKLVPYEGSGIRPLLEILNSKTDYSGFFVADKIVGKAAALLFIKMKAAAVYGSVLSEAAGKVLTENNIPYSFGLYVKEIINRKGDGICPMEKAVGDADDPDTAYEILNAAVYGS